MEGTQGHKASRATVAAASAALVVLLSTPGCAAPPGSPAPGPAPARPVAMPHVTSGGPTVTIRRAETPDDRAMLRPHQPAHVAGAAAMALEEVVFYQGRPIAATVHLGGPTRDVDAVILALMTDECHTRFARLFVVGSRDHYQLARPTGPRRERRTPPELRRELQRLHIDQPGRDAVEVLEAHDQTILGRRFTRARLRLNLYHWYETTSLGPACFELQGHPLDPSDPGMPPVRLVGERQLCPPGGRATEQWVRAAARR